jgi:hypothetical protein
MYNNLTIMSYYILPKKNSQVSITPKFEEKEAEITGFKPKPLISHSLIHYLNKQKQQSTLSEEILKVVNSYEFLFSKVPGYKFSVSKMKPPSEKFYLLMELTHIFNLFDPFSKKDITTMHFGNCPQASIECLDILREDNQDVHISMNELFKSIETPQLNNIHNIEFMYFDNNESISEFSENDLVNEKNNLDLESDSNANSDSDFNDLLFIFLNILIYQSNNGVSVIKVNELFYRPILDIIFLLTGVYEKVYIIKPNTSNTLKNERFLVCKCFSLNQYNSLYIENLKRLIIQLVFMKENKHKYYLKSLVDCELPYYFLNKVEESNIIIGQQQLDAYDQAINIMKNKNKEEKIENLKKNNIQKCIQMCEKFKIPYNKFAEKVNIFLQGHSNSHETTGDQDSAPNIFLNPSMKFNLKEMSELAIEETETGIEETETGIEEAGIENEYECIEHIIKNIIEKIIDDE